VITDVSKERTISILNVSILKTDVRNHQYTVYTASLHRMSQLNEVAQDKEVRWAGEGGKETSTD
jgi:hypothetical protein